MTAEAHATLDRLDPRSRILGAALFAGLTVTLRQPEALAVALATAAVLAVAARLEPWPTIKRMLALDGFMVTMLLLLPFTMAGTPLFELAGKPASHEGVTEAAVLLARANAAALASLALLGGMGTVRLGHGLAGLRLPAGFVQLVLFSIRYIAVIEQEYARLRLAMRARAFRLTASPRAWACIGTLFGMLLVRSLERAERVFAAMRCRGFSGRFAVVEESRWQRADIAFALAVLALTVVLWRLDRA